MDVFRVRDSVIGDYRSFTTASIDIKDARLRAELDAAAFHLYGLTRDEASYVLETFPIVKRKDEAAFGVYRTKELILDAYDAMSCARASGTAYHSPWTQEVSQ